MPSLPQASPEKHANNARHPASGRLDALKQSFRDHFGWVAGLFLVGLV